MLVHNSRFHVVVFPTPLHVGPAQLDRGLPMLPPPVATRRRQHVAVRVRRLRLRASAGRTLGSQRSTDARHLPGRHLRPVVCGESIFTRSVCACVDIAELQVAVRHHRKIFDEWREQNERVRVIGAELEDAKDERATAVVHTPHYATTLSL